MSQKKAQPPKAKKTKSKGKVPPPEKKPTELSDDDLDGVSGGYTSTLSGGYASGFNTILDSSIIESTLTNTIKK
jgi:hypothetical protein